MLNKGFQFEGIFDSEIPTATKILRKEAEQYQVKDLVKKKGGFCASLI